MPFEEKEMTDKNTPPSYAWVDTETGDEVEGQPKDLICIRREGISDIEPQLEYYGLEKKDVEAAFEKYENNKTIYIHADPDEAGHYSIEQIVHSEKPKRVYSRKKLTQKRKNQVVIYYENLNRRKGALAPDFKHDYLPFGRVTTARGNFGPARSDDPGEYIWFGHEKLGLACGLDVTRRRGTHNDIYKTAETKDYYRTNVPSLKNFSKDNVTKPTSSRRPNLTPLKTKNLNIRMPKSDDDIEMEFEFEVEPIIYFKKIETWSPKWPLSIAERKNGLIGEGLPKTPRLFDPLYSGGEPARPAGLVSSTEQLYGAYKRGLSKKKNKGDPKKNSPGQNLRHGNETVRKGGIQSRVMTEALTNDEDFGPNFRKWLKNKGESKVSADLYAEYVVSDKYPAVKTKWLEEPKEPKRTTVVLTSQEWCHLFGHGDGGKDVAANLVSGSHYANTEQLAIEIGQRVGWHPNLKARITAYTFRGAPDLANCIRYKLYHVQQFDGQKEERKIFDHVFDGQCESLDYNEFRILKTLVEGVIAEATGSSEKFWEKIKSNAEAKEEDT